MSWQEGSRDLGESGRAIQHDSFISSGESNINLALYDLRNKPQKDKAALAQDIINVQTSIVKHTLETHFNIPSDGIEILDDKEVTFVHGQDRWNVGTYFPGAIVVDRYNEQLGFSKVAQRLAECLDRPNKGLFLHEIEEHRFARDAGIGSFAMAMAHLLAPLHNPARAANIQEYYTGSGMPLVRLIETKGKRFRWTAFTYSRYNELQKLLDPASTAYKPTLMEEARSRSLNVGKRDSLLAASIPS